MSQWDCKSPQQYQISEYDTSDSCLHITPWDINQPVNWLRPATGHPLDGGLGEASQNGFAQSVCHSYLGHAGGTGCLQLQNLEKNAQKGAKRMRCLFYWGNTDNSQLYFAPVSPKLKGELCGTYKQSRRSGGCAKGMQVGQVMMIFHRTPEAAPALAAAAVAMFSWGGTPTAVGFRQLERKKTSLAMQVRNCCGRTMTGRTMYFASWCALRVW